MANTISNSDDVIDSRVVIARIEELESLGDERDDELNDELQALQSLSDEANSADDWIYGATLIRDSYFKEYTQQLAEELGLIENDSTWPHNCIDWDQAANELQVDYSSVEFDGVTYWVRM